MTESSDECAQCTRFKPHLYYPYIGLCVAKDEVREGRRRVEGCPYFRAKTLDEVRESLTRKEWVYCVSCRKTLTSVEELEEHVMKGHAVFEEVLVDDVVAEEAPSGD
ncbi:MAG: hypothetical protein QXS63_01220 [Zestosphaera sp.]